MSDIGSLVDMLIASGTPPAVAAQVVAQAFAAGVACAPIRDNPRDERDERRRETDRLRQQRYRDRNATLRDKRDNPRDVTNASLSKEEKKEETKQERGEHNGVSRGQRLPDGWMMTAQDQATAEALIGSSRVVAELEKFRDHWKQQPGAKGVKLDWDATWRNWIRRAAEYGGTRNGNRNHTAARGSPSADFFAGMRSVAADIVGDGAAPGPAAAEIPRGRIEIDG